MNVYDVKFFGPMTQITIGLSLEEIERIRNDVDVLVEKGDLLGTNFHAIAFAISVLDAIEIKAV